MMFKFIVGEFNIKDSTYELICAAPNGFAMKVPVGLKESLKETVDKVNALNAMMMTYVAQNFIGRPAPAETGLVGIPDGTKEQESETSTESNIIEGESVREGIQVGTGETSESPIEEAQSRL